MFPVQVWQFFVGISAVLTLACFRAGQIDSVQCTSQRTRRSEKRPEAREHAEGNEGKNEERAAKVAALGERQVERRREKSLMHALSLLRNIKCVIQGLPEDRALSPSGSGSLAASNSGSGMCPSHFFPETMPPCVDQVVSCSVFRFCAAAKVQILSVGEETHSFSAFPGPAFNGISTVHVLFDKSVHIVVDLQGTHQFPLCCLALTWRITRRSLLLRHCEHTWTTHFRLLRPSPPKHPLRLNPVIVQQSVVGKLMQVMMELLHAQLLDSGVFSQSFSRNRGNMARRSNASLTSTTEEASISPQKSKATLLPVV